MSVFHKKSSFHFSRQMFRGHFSTVSSILCLPNIVLINNAFNNDNNIPPLPVYLETSATSFGFKYIICAQLSFFVNPLNPELNPICYLLALLGAHHFLHVGRIRVKLLNFRRLMSYIYGTPILDVSRSHTTTQHSR